MSGTGTSSGLQSIQTQASTIHQVSGVSSSFGLPPASAISSHHPPQILQASSSSNNGSSYSKLKPYNQGETAKNTSVGPFSSHHVNVMQAELKSQGPLLPNMMSLNLSNNNTSGNRSTQRPSIQSTQQNERKGLACLSQDRVIASAAANNMMKTGKPISTVGLGSQN